MARRRINTKFLGIAAAAVVGVAGMGVLAQRYFVHGDPRQFIAAGDMFAKQKDWGQAAGMYAQAAQLSPRDASVWVKFGNAQMELRSIDHDQATAAVSSWNHATEIDPNYSPAWARLLTVYMDDLSGQESMHRATAGSFARTREVASQAVRLNPKDAAVSGIPIELDLRMWLDNIPLPAARGADLSLTDAQRADADIAQLSKIAASDTHFPYWIARAKIRQGEDALHDGLTEVAYARFNEAAAAFDPSIAQRPKDVTLYLTQFDILGQLLSYDNRADARVAYDRKRRDGLDRAQSIIDPADPLFVVVKTQYASLVAPTDPPKAETIYRDLIAKYPTNYGIRVNLAALLGEQPRRSDDALALLAQLPAQPPATVVGNARLVMEGQLTDAQLTRASIQAKQLQTATTSADRDRLNVAISSELAAVPQRFLSDWHVLEAIGKVQLQQGKVRDAIQSLEHAADRLKTQDPNRREVSLLLAQADAYRAGGQPSQSITLYEEALAEPRAAADPLPHLRLAQLYLSLHDRDDAAPHVEWLKQRFPYDVQVVGLQIAALDPVKDHDQIVKLFSGLPENDDGARLRKVEVAQQIGDTADMARLLDLVYNDHPGDPHVAYDLARADMAVNQPDAARQVVRESLKINPDSTPLKLLDEQLSGASASVRDATARQGLDAIKDPLVRAEQLARYDDSINKPADAVEQLKKAFALAPKKTEVVADLFSHYLSARQYKEAEPLLVNLTDLDADQAHGLVYRFNFYFAKGDIPDSLTVGQQLTREFPEFSDSWSCLGQALEAAGQTEDAASKYLTALERKGTNYAALRHLINCSYQLNRIADAQQYIAQGRQRFPSDTAFRQLEIEHMLSYGDPQNAVATVLETLKSSPDDRGSYMAAAEVISRAAAIVRSKGKADVAAADLQQARDVLKQAVDRWPDEPTFVVPYASSLNATGDFAGGEAAIRDFGSRPLWKDRPDIPLSLARYYQSAGRVDLAEAPLRQALSLSKDSPAVRNELITNLIGERKYDDALTELKAEPPSPAVDRQRVQTLLDASRTADAEAAARDALVAHPHDTSLQNLLALSLLRGGKLPAAAALVNAALGTDDQNVGAHNVRAMIDMARQPPQSDEATRDLQFVLTREPGNGTAANSLADLQAQGGDVDAASHTLETALRVSPQSKEMRLKLVEMYSRATPPRWEDATRVAELGMAYGPYKDDPDLLRLDAMVWARRGNGDNAISAIRSALKNAPNRSDLVHDYFTILLLTHNDAQLLSESQTLLNNPPVPWWVYSSRGSALLHTDPPDPAAAAAQYDLALTAAGAANNALLIDTVVSSLVQDMGTAKAVDMVLPRAQNSITWKLETASLLARAGQVDRALTLLDASLATLDNLPPSDRAHALMLGGSLYLASQPPAVDKAIAMYKKLLDLEPDNALALNNLAYLLSELVNPPQPAQALVYSQRAFDSLRAQGRVEPLIYDTQAWVLILDGRVDDGIDVLHQVIDKARFPEAHYHLAEAYLRKQMPLDAQRELLTADDLIDKAKGQNRSVDASLKGKVASALREAGKMQDAKSEAK